jgi:pyridinium-3,5-bisthiocarboxylic acid mononucleotide nickel chelatase
VKAGRDRPQAAILDLFSGVSGDMLLGALLDAGAPLESIVNPLKSLNLPGFDLSLEKQVKKGISCTRAVVQVEEEKHPHRKLKDIESIVRQGHLPDEIIEQALQAFQKIAEAEAKIHGKSIQDIHFHEVGALDAVVDIVGTLLGVQALGIERFYCGFVATGTGIVKSAHGVLPVPAPATLEILGDFPLRPSGIEKEIVTPTGAALLRTLVCEPGRWPEGFQAESVGYGCGTRELPGQANVVRLVVGRTEQSEAHRVSVIETNIDDTSPEIFGYLMERLFEAGALDAYYTPIQGKKNRPAVLVTVLGHAGNEDQLAGVLLEETSSLGVRISRCSRTCVKRDKIQVQTRWGSVGVKVAHFSDRTKASPEYEDCRRIARQQGIPLQDVYEETRRCYENQ